MLEKFKELQVKNTHIIKGGNQVVYSLLEDKGYIPDNVFKKHSS